MFGLKRSENVYGTQSWLPLLVNTIITQLTPLPILVNTLITKLTPLPLLVSTIITQLTPLPHLVNTIITQLTPLAFYFIRNEMRNRYLPCFCKTNQDIIGKQCTSN